MKNFLVIGAVALSLGGCAEIMLVCATEEALHASYIAPGGLGSQRTQAQRDRELRIYTTVHNYCVQGQSVAAILQAAADARKARQ